MSSILKALKRLEEQKAVRRDLAHDMEWVGGGPGLPVEKRRWPTMAALAAVALVSGVSTYWLTERGSGRRQPASPIVEVDGRPDAARLSTPVTPPAPEAPRETVVQPSAPAGPRPAVVSLAPPREVREVPALDGEDPDAAAVPLRAEPRRAPRQTAAPRPAEPAPARPATASSPPRLNVTGIAWQGDGQVHFAVVNGQSVTEGSTVDGARVEKISRDRVSFSFRNRTFEVPLGEGSGGP